MKQRSTSDISIATVFSTRLIGPARPLSTPPRVPQRSTETDQHMMACRPEGESVADRQVVDQTRRSELLHTAKSARINSRNWRSASL
ncbi:MAG: hypothetical protein JWQ81_8486 [Amycolatopsis sp.]|nr:hypothetical protein [Amycolatopsis sp.]